MGDDWGVTGKHLDGRLQAPQAPLSLTRHSVDNHSLFALQSAPQICERGCSSVALCCSNEKAQLHRRQEVCGATLLVNHFTPQVREFGMPIQIASKSGVPRERDAASRFLALGPGCRSVPKRLRKMEAAWASF
jgi:hypothetical protein